MPSLNVNKTNWVVFLVVVLLGTVACATDTDFQDSEAVDAAAHFTLGGAMGCDFKRQGVGLEAALDVVRQFARSREELQKQAAGNTCGDGTCEKDVEQWVVGAETGWLSCNIRAGEPDSGA